MPYQSVSAQSVSALLNVNTCREFHYFTQQVLKCQNGTFSLIFLCHWLPSGKYFMGMYT